MRRWSQLLQSFFVIFGCCLELLGLLLVCKLLFHIHSPEPHGRDFCLTVPASRERRTLWGFLGYRPFAGDVTAGRALEFAAPVPQTRCSRRSPRSDTPSPDCLRLTHSPVLVQAERGGGGGQGEKPSKYPRLLWAWQGGGAGGGGAERAGLSPQRRAGGPGWSPPHLPEPAPPVPAASEEPRAAPGLRACRPGELLRRYRNLK